MTASKKEQAIPIKRRLAHRHRGTMAAAPPSHMHIKKLAVEEGVLSKCLSLDVAPELVGGSMSCSVTSAITDLHCDFQQELSGV